MAELTKNVFISYRHETSEPHAFTLFHELEKRGYTVFLDQKRLGSGIFKTKIKPAIEASAHFISILAPDSLTRCSDRNDWVRKEIETAMGLLPAINIIPFLIGHFNFDDVRIKNDLKSAGRKVGTLPDFQYVHYTPNHMDEAVEKLVRYISSFNVGPNDRIITLSPDTSLTVMSKGKPVTIQPVSNEEITDKNRRNLLNQLAKELKVAVELGDNHLEKRLLAADYCLRGSNKADAGDYAGAIADYDSAIELVPDVFLAFNNRGHAYYKAGQFSEATEDYKTAIYFDRHDPYPYNNLGVINLETGALSKAELDFKVAITLDASFSRPYYHLGHLYYQKKNREKALEYFHLYLQKRDSQRYKNQKDVEEIIKKIEKELDDIANGRHFETLGFLPSEDEYDDVYNFGRYSPLKDSDEAVSFDEYVGYEEYEEPQEVSMEEYPVEDDPNIPIDPDIPF